MSDKESLAARLDRHKCRMAPFDEIEDWQEMDIIGGKIRILEAEFDQYLTAHAILNDKVCALESAVEKERTLKEWARVDADEATKEIAELKAENVILEEQLLQMHEGLTLVAAENIELKAELDQCLTAHAILNDKVCALEAENSDMHTDRFCTKCGWMPPTTDVKLDDSNDRCIAEHWNKLND